MESAEPFTAQRSLFSSRAAEADARAPLDGVESAEAALELVWKPMVKRPGFKSAVVRATKRTGTITVLVQHGSSPHVPYFD